MAWEWFFCSMILWGKCQYYNTYRVSIRIKHHHFCLSAQFSISVYIWYLKLSFFPGSSETWLFLFCSIHSILPTGVFLGVWRGEKRPRKDTCWLPWSWKKGVSSSQGSTTHSYSPPFSEGSIRGIGRIRAPDPGDRLKMQRVVFILDRFHVSLLIPRVFSLTA